MLIFFFPFEALRRHRWSSGSGDPAFPFAFDRGLVRPLSVVREEGRRVVGDMVEDKDTIKRNVQTANTKRLASFYTATPEMVNLVST